MADALATTEKSVTRAPIDDMANWSMSQALSESRRAGLTKSVGREALVTEQFAGAVSAQCGVVGIRSAGIQHCAVMS